MEKKIYTEKDIVALLKSRITYDFGQNMLAEELGLSKGYLCDVLGGKRGIGEQIIKALGFQTVYVKKGKR